MKIQVIGIFPSLVSETDLRETFKKPVHPAPTFTRVKDFADSIGASFHPILGERANKTNIVRLLEIAANPWRTGKQGKNEDRLVIVFILSHGGWWTHSLNKTINSQEVLWLKTETFRIQVTGEDASDTNTILTSLDLRKILFRAKVKMLFILGCCHSGAALNLPTVIERHPQNKDHIVYPEPKKGSNDFDVWCACDKEHETWSDSISGSLFFWGIIKEWTNGKNFIEVFRKGGAIAYERILRRKKDTSLPVRIVSFHNNWFSRNKVPERKRK